VFSLTSTYRIDEYFPLLTKRKLFPKAVFAELVWMLSGSTNNDDLVKLGANFWTPWVDIKHPDNQNFYKKTGLPVGMLGPVYGFQMRHFGGHYGLDKNDYGRGGFDQISWLVNEIKTNPYSRRLIVSLWNPKDMDMMRLPPCHYCFHVFIDTQKRMSLLLNQRSCDFPIGIPANILYYSALCYMLCQQTGYTPYQFIHHTEDAHIYVNQLDAVKEYLDREERQSPKLSLKKADNIFAYMPNDFVIEDYNPLPAIKVPVTV
jgi:thymidylate synthase